MTGAGCSGTLGSVGRQAGLELERGGSGAGVERWCRHPGKGKPILARIFMHRASGWYVILYQTNIHWLVPKPFSKGDRAGLGQNSVAVVGVRTAVHIGSAFWGCFQCNRFGFLNIISSGNVLWLLPAFTD